MAWQKLYHTLAAGKRGCVRGLPEAAALVPLPRGGPRYSGARRGRARIGRTRRRQSSEWLSCSGAAWRRRRTLRSGCEPPGRFGRCYRIEVSFRQAYTRSSYSDPVCLRETKPRVCGAIEGGLFAVFGSRVWVETPRPPELRKGAYSTKKCVFPSRARIQVLGSGRFVIGMRKERIQPVASNQKNKT
jgi:hypothetical protein